MTAFKKPAFVQLQANREVDDGVEPAQDRSEVEFYSIYLGEPGDYQWVADFKCNTTALNAAHHMVMAFGCELDRSQYDTVMSTPAPEPQPEPQPKGHPHAALMAEYAKDAAETNTPWRRWEMRRGPKAPWTACLSNPGWLVAYSYRRKPEPLKTITVNGFEVPAPLDNIEFGTTVYIASPGSLSLYVMVVYTSGHSDFFDRKIVHATREAAAAHAKAMLGVNPKGDA